MCLLATIIPWVVDFFDSLGFTITIRTRQDESLTSARAVGSTPTVPYSSYSSHSSSCAFFPFFSGSVALLEGGGRDISIPAILQMTTITSGYRQSTSPKENISKDDNNRGKLNANTAFNPSDGIIPGSPSGSNSARSSRTCCFCWCCCCSCSCITVQNGDQSFCQPKIKKPEELDFVHKIDEIPSQEETKAWGESFDKLMQSIKGRDKFREFLRSEFSEENVLFWLACEELKKQTNPDSIEERARSIYEDYISILSPKETEFVRIGLPTQIAKISDTIIIFNEGPSPDHSFNTNSPVSLDSRAREVINRNMVQPSPHTFDDAQLQIYTLMHRDSYPRFLNSNIYKRLLVTQ